MLFILEYALAKLLINYGVTPSAFIGHSIGEYVAACLSGVFSFEDAIALVCQRGLLMASVSTGSMLAIECSAEEFSTYPKIADVELALHNASNHCVASGAAVSIDHLEQYLLQIGKSCQKLKVSHAFHSQFMEKIEAPFKDILSNIKLSAPLVPIISNVTGDWLSTSEAIDPEYWYRHLRHTVQLCKGFETLLADEHPFFIEVGPGRSLNTFLKGVASCKKPCMTYTLPSQRCPTSDRHQLMSALGLLWQGGIHINWLALYGNEKPRHIPLPTYSFQKQRYWIEPDDAKQYQANQNNKLQVVPQLSVTREDLNVGGSYLAPRNEREKQLAQLWQENLGIENISIDDDFFALGGHSLKALSLIEKMNKMLECSFSINHLYGAPTIMQLAALMTSRSDQQNTEIVVPLKVDDGASPRMFLCHPASGMIYCFDPLISNCQHAVSIYGLQDPSVTMGELLYDSIFSMAEAYLREIKKTQPQGPYFLMGYSLGGTVLYEVAHMMQQQNDKVELLALIDSWAIFSPEQSNEHHVKKTIQSFHKDLPDYLVELTWARVKLLLEHKPTKMKQDMILFKATDLFDDYLSIEHPENGWSNFNEGTIVCHTINANHETIINGENSQNILDLIKNAGVF